MRTVIFSFTAHFRAADVSPAGGFSDKKENGAGWLAGAVEVGGRVWRTHGEDAIFCFFSCFLQKHLTSYVQRAIIGNVKRTGKPDRAQEKRKDVLL